MSKKDLANVMYRAWAIVRATGKTLSVALTKAWALYRLTKQLRKAIVRFAYEKADGTIRKATGTLQNIEELIKGAGKSGASSTMRYYDIEARGFRSFRVENLITIY